VVGRQKVRFRQCGQYNRGVISPEIDDTIGKDNRLSPSISRFSFDNESTFTTSEDEFDACLLFRTSIQKTRV
ncbi:hypothetical protein, partial [Halonotius terrestris]|uniref:hypothetical protein n=1 Tax=Halonotius terrestris TaxID=2487750 RepID=UPI001C8EBFD4